jgi:hypothetical protein
MQNDDIALDFLNSLEYSEASLLLWGVVDSFFSEDELRSRAEVFFDETAPPRRGHHESGIDLIESLLANHLLYQLPENGRYRTRMGETIRLFSRLRQIFPSPNNDAWRTAPGLVADYRLLVRRRVFPARSVEPEDVLLQVGNDVQIGPLQQTIIRSFLGVEGPSVRKTAPFQVRATSRILRSVNQPGSQGTVVSAGTGSGKTMAFYLPAYAAIGPLISNEFWVKCLALYPRNELLKDQLKEALSAARRIKPALKTSGRRALAVAALYGGVPNSTRDVTSGRNPWRRVNHRGQRAYECPFLRCPVCEGHMCWTETDLTASNETLRCMTDSCGSVLDPEEIRLTRTRMRKEPPDILFTTTEMLNKRMGDSNFRGMFGIQQAPERRPFLFLLDEVHTYEGIHGAHVALLLRRWRRVSDARPHFVGLSATLADAPRFFADLIGLVPGAVSEISPFETEVRGMGAEYTLILRGDPASGTSLLSTTIQALMLLRRVLAFGPSDEFGSKVFAFTDNLDVTNRLFHNLLDAEALTSSGAWNPAKPQGSLANLRASTMPQARPRWIAGQNWNFVEEIGHPLTAGHRLSVGRTSSQDLGVDHEADIVVATASLEVGYDDPEVGAVLQHKAPLSASAYLQRKGRAGRKQSMRPWTVIVLSDFGRDRAAFQGYDQLFSPVLGARYLPLTNKAVLKMQATFVLFDWLATKIPSNMFPNAWSDFSQPSGELVNAEWSAKAAERETIYKRFLTLLLAEKPTQEEFARFLGRSLGLNPEDVNALLWESPRSVLMEAAPTLLRRLETHWREAATLQTEPHKARHPLPEFVPETLFSDLQLPEVTVVLPATNQGNQRLEAMPIASALREFAPGRVSRRFGIAHGNEKHWVSSEGGTDLWIDAFCSDNDRLDLGAFAYRGPNQEVIDIQVFRPTAITVVSPHPSIQQSSNSFLSWRTQIVLTDVGHELEVADSRKWSPLLSKIQVHSHNLGLPLEVRRFAVGATSTVGRGKQPAVTTVHTFSAGPDDGDKYPVALGFAADVDGLRIEFRYPADLVEAAQRHQRLVRGLRPFRFRHLLSVDPVLSLLANSFQIDWLAQVYISTLILRAVRMNVSIEQAAESEAAGELASTIAEVIDTIMRSGADADDDDSSDDGTNGHQHVARIPRRLGEISDLMADPSVRMGLRRAAVSLWEPINSQWTPWLGSRFKATLGVAILDTISSLCPRIEEGSLLLDLDPLVSPEEAAAETDSLWLTEATIGGAGFIEEFISEYSKDPRRFLRILDSKLAASDLEVTADQLARSVYLACSNTERGASLAAAFEGVRSAASHVESVAATQSLRETLSNLDMPPTVTFMVSLNSRVLHLGTSSGTDRFVTDAIREWDEAEDRIGIDIDLRAFCLFKSADDSLPTALGLSSSTPVDLSSQAWRYSVLYAMLWPKGSQLRVEALRAWSPYEPIPACDRLLVLAAIDHTIQRISMDEADWFTLFAEAIARDGSVDIYGPASNPRHFSDALLAVGANPVDSETLLVHARITGVRTEGDQFIANFELPEAYQ